jgi:competence protein CoiA
MESALASLESFLTPEDAIMSMFVALNSQQQLVTIHEVSRGLACTCTCVECGETLIARQGALNEHHFAHYSNKASCEVGRETLLHLYGKQVIREAMGLQVPHLPDHPPEFGDLSSWWDFESVQEEVWLGRFRPDLVAHLRGGQQLLIEIAVTSFIDDEKLGRIKAAGLWALEIDLSGLLDGREAIPSEAIRQQILHQVDCKQWMYPAPERLAVKREIPLVDPVFVAKNQLTEYRYTIRGMWVTARMLPSGSLAVRSLAYSPQIRDLLKTMAAQLGGYYKSAYRNWIFPAEVTPRLIELLENCARME